MVQFAFTTVAAFVQLTLLARSSFSLPIQSAVSNAGDLKSSIQPLSKRTKTGPPSANHEMIPVTPQKMTIEDHGLFPVLHQQSSPASKPPTFPAGDRNSHPSTWENTHHELPGSTPPHAAVRKYAVPPSSGSPVTPHGPKSPVTPKTPLEVGRRDLGLKERDLLNARAYFDEDLLD